MSNKTVPLTEAYSAYTQPLEPQILEEIPKKKWAAITALVLSLIAFFTGILVIGFVPAIFAIVFAGIALGQVKKGEAEGAGMAIGAIIFASLAIIASVGIVILALISNYYTEQQVIDDAPPARAPTPWRTGRKSAIIWAMPWTCSSHIYT